MCAAMVYAQVVWKLYLPVVSKMLNIYSYVCNKGVGLNKWVSRHFLYTRLLETQQQEKSQRNMIVSFTLNKIPHNYN